jgi:hypothetical protein
MFQFKMFQVETPDESKEPRPLGPLARDEDVEVSMIENDYCTSQ